MKRDINIQLREWWIAELKAITQKVMNAEAKRQTREREKWEKKLGDYQTFADAQDAYGCGVLTEKQYNRILEMQEKAKPKDDELYRAKLDLLQELYKTQKEFLEKDMRWEETHQHCN